MLFSWGIGVLIPSLYPFCIRQSSFSLACPDLSLHYAPGLHKPEKIALWCLVRTNEKPGNGPRVFFQMVILVESMLQYHQPIRGVAS